MKTISRISTARAAAGGARPRWHGREAAGSARVRVWLPRRAHQLVDREARPRGPG